MRHQPILSYTNLCSLHLFSFTSTHGIYKKEYILHKIIYLPLHIGYLKIGIYITQKLL